MKNNRYEILKSKINKLAKAKPNTPRSSNAQVSSINCDPQVETQKENQKRFLSFLLQTPKGID